MCYVLDEFGRERVEVGKDLCGGARLTVMKEAFAHVEGKALAVVGSDAELTLHLLACRIELLEREWRGNKLLEFGFHEVKALIHIVWVATKINRPRTRLVITGQHTLHRIYKAALLAQRKIKPRI